MATKARKYKKVACSTTVAGAKKKQKALKAKGYTAQRRGKCVFSAGKMKSRKNRKK